MSWREEGGGEVWKSSFKWDIPKNQRKINAFWVGYFHLRGKVWVEGCGEGKEDGGV